MDLVFDSEYARPVPRFVDRERKRLCVRVSVGVGERECVCVCVRERERVSRRSQTCEEWHAADIVVNPT